MTDNVPITAGAGTSVATDDIGGVHYQITKLAFGALDTATLVATGSGLPVAVQGTVPVSGAFYQATQPVSGTVAVTGAYQATQPVSIATMPSTPVTGTFWQATQPVSLASTTITGSVAVTGTFWQATQPISGTVTANLGTVAGLALDATITGGSQRTKLTDGTNNVGVADSTTAASETAVDRLKVNSAIRLLDTAQTAGSQLVAAKGDQTTGLWVNVKNASLAVTGTFFQATQPVSIAATVAVSGPLTDTQLRAAVVPVSLASTTITGTVTTTGPLTDTQLRATPVPVSGTVTTGGLTDTQLRAAVVPTSSTDTTASGNITAISQSVALALNGKSGAAIQITGTWVGTLQFEGTVDGTNWVTVNGVYAGASAPGATTTVNGIVRLTPSGLAQLRITSTAWTSGTAVISIRASDATGGTFINQSLTAGTNIIGKVGIDQTTPGTTNLVSIGTNGTVALNAAIPTGANVIGAVTQSGTWNVGTITTLPSLVAGAAVIGALTANQSVNVSQINAVAPLMGNGITGTGSQRVTIASDNTAFAVNATLQTGANVIGSLAANQSTNIAQMGGVAVTMGSGVTGTGVQRVVLATDVALPAGTNSIGTTPGPALTKGTQGTVGHSTQDLKDGGRAIVNAATAIAGVTCVTTEALLSLNISRDGAATAAATSHAVTSGKRWRITGVSASMRSTGATVLSARVALRMNPAGAATATSPVIAILSMTQQAAALAEAGDSVDLMFPDGIEVSGTMQVGLSQVCSAITGVVYASLIGYEY